MRWSARIFTICLGLLLALVAHATPVDATDGALPVIALQGDGQTIDLSGRSSFWIDDSGLAGPSQAQAHWRDFPKDSSPPLQATGQRFSIHDKALWIHFVAQTPAPTALWVLEVGLPGVDGVSLYWQDPQGRWIEQHAGDSVPVSQWPLPDRFPLLKLATGVSGPTAYYLQIRHQRAIFSAPMHIMGSSSLMSTREREHLLLGVYFGLAILAAITGTFTAFAQRDVSFASYTLYVSMLAFAQLSYLGLAGQYLWPDAPYWNNAAAFLLPVLAACTGLFFVWQVIVPRNFSRWLDKLVLVWIALVASLGTIDTFWPSLLVFRLVNLALLAMLPLIYGMCWLAWRRGDRYARLMAWGFAPVVLGALFPVLRNIGLVATNTLTVYSLTLGATIETPILFYAILQRAAGRRETLARSLALQTTDPLTALRNPRVLLTRLHESLLRAQRSGKPCALLLIQLVNHPWFVKEHGREMADKALVLTASRLRRVSREVDVAARTGDAQFALLLEGPCSTASVVATATRILARALRPSDLLPVGAQLKLHICAARLPDATHAPGTDAQAVLSWIGQELAAMQAQPRKTIKSLNF